MDFRLDIRFGLACGILGALSLGFVFQSFTLPGLRLGYRTNRALERSVGGDLDRARFDLEVVVSECPEDPGGWVRLGRVLQALSLPHEALECFDRAAALDSSSARIEYDRAKVLVSMSMWEEAWAASERTLALRPKHADVRFLQSKIEAARGNATHAVALLDAAIQRGASDPARLHREAEFDPIRHEFAFASAKRRILSPSFQTRENP